MKSWDQGHSIFVLKFVVLVLAAFRHNSTAMKENEAAKIHTSMEILSKITLNQKRIISMKKESRTSLPS